MKESKRMKEAIEAQKLGEVKFISKTECVRCGGFEFYSGFDPGTVPKCVKCSVERTSEYRAKNKDKISESGKSWYQENKEYALARSRAYYEKNKDRIAKYNSERSKRIREEKKLAELINNS